MKRKLSTPDHHSVLLGAHENTPPPSKMQKSGSQWKSSQMYSSERPSFSYAQLIAQALVNSDQGKLSLKQIYAWINQKYPFYQFGCGNWQNSIRHNLSLNSQFSKEAKLEGKGSLWTIDLNCLPGLVDKGVITTEMYCELLDRISGPLRLNSSPQEFTKNTQKVQPQPPPPTTDPDAPVWLFDSKFCEFMNVQQQVDSPRLSFGAGTPDYTVLTSTPYLAAINMEDLSFGFPKW